MKNKTNNITKWDKNNSPLQEKSILEILNIAMSHIDHAYLTTDGIYSLPNSKDGDILKYLIVLNDKMNNKNKNNYPDMPKELIGCQGMCQKDYELIAKMTTEGKMQWHENDQLFSCAFKERGFNFWKNAQGVHLDAIRKQVYCK